MATVYAFGAAIVHAFEKANANKDKKGKAKVAQTMETPKPEKPDWESRSQCIVDSKSESIAPF